MTPDLHEGVVRSGLGDCARWIERLAEAYQGVVGVRLWPGSLNVELPQPWSMPNHAVRLDTRPHGGSVTVFLAPCSVEGVHAYALRTEANERGDGDHPRTIVEIVASLHLRSHLGLADGDRVRLRLP
ncbi:MAG: DUF120 domain-containing protein [Planctomycetota bacterium]